MPLLGLGTWKSSEGSEADNAVKWALEAGYRHVDTAAIYGNERSVGKAVRESGLPREQVFITTKLWNADQKNARKALEWSLKRLDTSYADLYLIHWPQTGTRNAAWKELETLQREGLCRAIGVSNYTVRHLQELETQGSAPAVNQVEFSPFLNQQELLDYCTRKKIVVEAYSPLTRGEKLKDARITRIAQAHTKTNAQVLIRWSLQNGMVVLPKSSRKERIAENAGVFDFKLAPEEMKALDCLNENFRTCWNPGEID
ncbi:MAG: aldo/keto reductase [Candidatus Micrarchaeota archaeon]